MSHSSVPTQPGKPKLPDIKWGNNNGALIWTLINHIEKSENRHVFLGKANKDDNTKGDSRAKVCKRIAEAILPEYYAIDPTSMGNRVKTKIDSLVTQYKNHARSLRVTGGGLNPEDSQQSQDAGSVEFLDFYIPADGPTDQTPGFARNLWEKINQEFPFFSKLHSLFGTRPSVVPIIVTTGVGPSGPKSIYYQAPTHILGNSAAASSGQQSDLAASSAPSPPLPAPSASVPAPPDSAPAAPGGIAPAIDPQLSTTVDNTQSSSKRAPKVSTASRIALERANAVQLVPQKRSVADTLLEISRENMNSLREKSHHELHAKQRDILLREFEAGIWTKTQYTKRIRRLEAETKDFKKHQANQEPTAKRQRLSSPGDEEDLDDDHNSVMPSSDI